MTLRDTCQSVGPSLTGLSHNGVPCDGALVLWALAGVESSYGRDREEPRYEWSYSPGGPVYLKSSTVRRLYERYGPAAACSYGSWQMMFPTAIDLGYTGPPGGLKDDATLAPLVVRYIARSQALTLPDVADAYNSGTYRDNIRPLDYTAKVVSAYERGWDGGPEHRNHTPVTA
jgi:hypothetical protein